MQIEAIDSNHIVAHWLDGSVPQNIPYDVDLPTDTVPFPILPEHSAENPPQLLQALRDACETTNPDAARYAFDCIQLNAGGMLAATDGRQFLTQSGFQFPWEEDLLIPASNIFRAAELSLDQPIRLGKSGNWVVLGSGPWTIYITINQEGRFPNLDRHIPRSIAAKTSCRFSAGDAKFLGKTLPRLPANAAFNFPVTLDLNGSVAVRAKAADQPQATEVVLNSSEWSGAPICINTNRTFFARAINLGFREILFFGNEVPVLCQDNRRRYGWALLDSKSAIGPGEDTLRIDAPRSGSDASVAIPFTPRRISIVSESTYHQNSSDTTSAAKNNGRGKTNGEAKVSSQARPLVSPKAGPQPIDNLLEQAESVRESLRETLVKTKDLVKGLKRQRQFSRSVESTLASLRQLKTLGI